MVKILLINKDNFFFYNFYSIFFSNGIEAGGKECLKHPILLIRDA